MIQTSVNGRERKMGGRRQKKVKGEGKERQRGGQRERERGRERGREGGREGGRERERGGGRRGVSYMYTIAALTSHIKRRLISNKTEVEANTCITAHTPPHNKSTNSISI